MLGGIWRWRRVWKRRDHQPLFYTALIVMAAAWIHASCAEESCDRYFLPIAIMASVFAALGLLALSRRFLLFADALQFAENKRMAMIFAPAAIVLFISVGSAFFVSYASRRAEVELAAWIHGHYVSPAMLLGSEGTTSVVAYYAGANWDTLGRKMDQQTALETARRVHPDVILLVATHFRDGPETERLARRIEELGFNKEDKNSLSCELEEEMVVLTKF
jgi:hypothetical protein